MLVQGWKERREQLYYRNAEYPAVRPGSWFGLFSSLLVSTACRCYRLRAYYHIKRTCTHTHVEVTGSLLVLQTPWTAERWPHGGGTSDGVALQGAGSQPVTAAAAARSPDISSCCLVNSTGITQVLSSAWQKKQKKKTKSLKSPSQRHQIHKPENRNWDFWTSAPLNSIRCSADGTLKSYWPNFGSWTQPLKRAAARKTRLFETFFAGVPHLWILPSGKEPFRGTKQ